MSKDLGRTIYLVCIGSLVFAGEKASETTAATKRRVEKMVKMLMEKGMANEQEARAATGRILEEARVKKEELKKAVMAEINDLAKKARNAAADVEKATRAKNKPKDKGR